MRVVIADDSALLREGLARLLIEAGHEVVEAVADAPSLLDAVAAHSPTWLSSTSACPQRIPTTGCAQRLR